jgi:sec-independent protein translocase protein TatA
MFGFGMGEGLILLAIVLLLFGGKKLPQLGSAVGKALSNFRSGIKEADEQDQIDNQKDA